MASRLGCTTGGRGEVGGSSSRVHLGEGEMRLTAGGEGEKSSDGRRL